MIGENEEGPLPARKGPFLMMRAKINPAEVRESERDKASGILFSVTSRGLDKKYGGVIGKRIVAAIRSSGIAEVTTDRPYRIDAGREDLLPLLEREAENAIRRFCRGVDVRVVASYTDDMEEEPESPPARSGRMEAGDRVFVCTMCQSLSMYHLCVISADMKGQCGQMTLEDAELMEALSGHGPCRGATIEKPVSPEKGEWVELNRLAEEATFGHTSRLTCYSVTDCPPPLGPLAETAVVRAGEDEPEFVIDRRDEGISPCGLSFSDAMELCRGGAQTPGITGRARS